MCVFRKTSGLAFQSAKLFGAGIVLSTALIHMLTMANETLRKPCLEPLLGAYPPLANLSALIGTLLTHWVQVVVHQGLSSLVSMEQRKYHHHPAPHDHEGEDHTHHNHQNDAPQLGHLHHHSIESSDSLSQHAQESEPLLLSPAVVLAIGQPTFKDENCVHSEEHTELILDGGHDHSHGVCIYKMSLLLTVE